MSKPIIINFFGDIPVGFEIEGIPITRPGLHHLPDSNKLVLVRITDPAVALADQEFYAEWRKEVDELTNQ